MVPCLHLLVSTYLSPRTCLHVVFADVFQSLKSEKELVKPLYDRYRRIKQYLAKDSVRIENIPLK